MKSLNHVVAATDDCGEPRIFWDAKSREADESNPGTTAACRFCHAIHHQRLQRPSNRQIPNSSPRTLLFQEFRRGLEIARPLKPLNALKPLMIKWRSQIFWDANLGESHLGAHRLFEINHYIVAISGVGVHQRLQRPSNRQIPNSSRRTRLVLEEFRRGFEIAKPLKPLTIKWRAQDFLNAKSRESEANRMEDPVKAALSCLWPMSKHRADAEWQRFDIARHHELHAKHAYARGERVARIADFGHPGIG